MGICGQAPSNFPELAKWLVEQGIDSISPNPDTALKTTLDVATAERRINLLIQSA
jgi:pyruvate,water dikinase